MVWHVLFIFSCRQHILSVFVGCVVSMTGILSVFFFQDMLARHGCPDSMENSSLDEHVSNTLSVFDTFSPLEQTEFTKRLLSRMSHGQQGQISNYLFQILQRDFISRFTGRLFAVQS